MAEKNYHCDNKGFIIYKDWEEMVAMLDPADCGRLFMALFAFASRGEEMQLDGMTKMAFIMMRNTIERDGVQWEEICERNKKNGSKGGRPKKPSGFSENPDKPKETNIDIETDRETDNETDSDSETDRETDNDSVTVIDSKTDSKTDIPVGRSVGRSSQSDNSNYSYEDTTPEDYSKVNLTDEEKAHLISLSDCLTVERYIQKIRDWQIRNRRINPTPYLTINRFFNEDNIKPHPVRQEEYKGISVEDYEAFARSIDLSRVTT